MRVSGFLLDLEGVLVGDKRYLPVETAAQFVQHVREAGFPVRVITNNTTDDAPTLVDRLLKAGIRFDTKDIHSTTSAAVLQLKKLKAQRCLILGNASLRRMFTEAGFEAVDCSEADAVVVGLDTEFTYGKLATACEAISHHGAAFLALHRNRRYKNEAGLAAPGVGAIVAAIECTTQIDPTVVGKPSKSFFQQALDDLCVAPADVLVVSDDPLTDLAGAKRMGMRAAFVLSGKYSDAKIIDGVPQEERPDVIVTRIGDLLTEGVIAL